MCKTLSLVLLLAVLGCGEARGQITFYERPDFRGRTFTSYDPIRNFQRYGFNDRAASVIVRSGTWEVCTDADFAGNCTTLKPGRYPTLVSMGIKNRISSFRPVEAAAAGEADPARLVLFGRPEFRGRSLVIDRPVVRNLAELGFNDRASSMRVERGYWLLCSDADFAGECRTFGPGEYPALTAELFDRVSSARRIHHRYPYRDRPHWTD